MYTQAADAMGLRDEQGQSKVLGACLPPHICRTLERPRNRSACRCIMYAPRPSDCLESQLEEANGLPSFQRLMYCMLPANSATLQITTAPPKPGPGKVGELSGQASHGRRLRRSVPH